jgi:hypothetical protein
MKWQDVLPVIISILIIILVAILQRQSRAPGGYPGDHADHIPAVGVDHFKRLERERQAVTQYTQGLVVGIIPTLFFIITYGFRPVPE